MKRKHVAIIDFGMGNLFSVAQACEKSGLIPHITFKPETIQDADALILPGVGAFGDAMNMLNQFDLVDPIKKFISTGKPFMGICLGFQLLMTSSSEFGVHKGLDVINGKVIKFNEKENPNHKMKIPHVGWNQIELPGNSVDKWKDSPLEHIKPGAFFYFVHSFFVVPDSKEVVLSTTDYEDTLFCSSIFYENIFACQFHPEKSAKNGIDIYKLWAFKIK